METIQTILPHPDGTAVFLDAFCDGLRPDPPLWIDEWSEQHMVIPADTGARLPGPYRLDTTPFARDVLRKLSPGSPAKRVVAKVASQLWKTQVGINWICASIARAPANVLALEPTQTLTERLPPLNLLRIEENLSAAHLRLSHAYIENLDWAKCIERYDRPHTFFYMDPPYLETAGYGVDFGLEQYEKMAGLLRGLKGKAIVSLNDHPEIRRVFDGFQMETVPIKYTVGGGGKAVDRSEVIIYSWDKASEPARLF